MNSRDPISRYHLAEVAGLLAEPARAAILIALLDGSARPATELSRLSGVAAATASTHLHKLCEGKLLTVVKQGRHRYYRLANEDVAHLVESLSLVRESRATSLPALPKDDAILRARTCYRHLGGRLGVRLFGRLNSVNGFSISDDSISLTSSGFELLATHSLFIGDEDIEKLGGGLCVDWTERQFHLSGPLGTYLLQRLVNAGWLRPNRETRALQISPSGLNGFAELGINLSDTL